MRRRRLLASAPALAGALLAGCDEAEPAPSAWRDPPLDPRDPRRAVLAWASRAPSLLNTQPWRVELTGVEGLRLGTDPARALPAHDPEGRQARLALGCFVELAALAAGRYGRRLEAIDGGGPEFRLRSNPAAGTDPLLAAVPQRCSTRRAFDSEKPVRPAHAEALARAAGRAVAVGFAVEPAQVAALRELVAAARTAALALPAVVAERARWLRLGAAATQDDGLPVPGLLARLGSAQGLAAETGLAGRIEALSWANLFAGTASFGWLVTAADDEAARLAAGRAYQRVDLAASLAGVAIHPLAEALGDMAGLVAYRVELERRLGVAPPGRVQMLFRLGYAGPAPPTPRRSVEALLSTG